MNADERNAIRGIVRDMKHNIEQVNQFLMKKGGLSTDGFIYRVERQAKSLEDLVEGRIR